MTYLNFSYLSCRHEPFLNFLFILMIFLLWHPDPKTSLSEDARYWATTYGDSKLPPPIIPVYSKHFQSNGTPNHNHFPRKFRPLSCVVLHVNLYPRLPFFSSHQGDLRCYQPAVTKGEKDIILLIKISLFCSNLWHQKLMWSPNDWIPNLKLSIKFPNKEQSHHFKLRAKYPKRTLKRQLCCGHKHCCLNSLGWQDNMDMTLLLFLILLYSTRFCICLSLDNN